MFESTPKSSQGLVHRGAAIHARWCETNTHTHNQRSMHPPASWLIKCVCICVCVYVPVWSRENSRNRSCTVGRLPVFLSFYSSKGILHGFSSPIQRNNCMFVRLRCLLSLVLRIYMDQVLMITKNTYIYRECVCQ